MLDFLNKALFALFDFVLPPSRRDTRVNTLTLADIPLSFETSEKCGVQVTTLWKYNDRFIHDLIWSLKYRKNAHAAQLCAEALADYLQEAHSESQWMQDERPIVFVPIPLASKRQRERGYNQIDLVLDHLRELVPSRVERKALQRIRETPPQTSLKRKERLENMRGAFALLPVSLTKGTEFPSARSLMSAHVILLDDVVTTGATLSAATAALKKAGVDAECIALARAGE